MSEPSCRCCLSLPPDTDLRAQNVYFGETEVYADMLKECFEIQLKLDGAEKDNGICSVCVLQLRSAYKFKKQVLQCQHAFEERLQQKPDLKGESAEVKVELDGSDDDNRHDEEPYFLDLKEELSFGGSKEEEDDKSLALLALEQITVKRLRKSERDGKRKRERTDRSGKRKLDAKTFLSKQLKLTLRNRDLIPIKLTPVSTLSDIAKHKTNVDNILKYSTAIPFSNKNLHGFVCAYCKEPYPDPSDLRDHVAINHKNSPLDYSKKKDGNNLCVKLDITDLKCNICNKNCDVVSNLKQHLTLEHEIKFYPDVNDYILEFKLSTDEVMNCALCHSTYETFKMLLQHMNGHYRNFVCDVCDLGFVNNQRLKNHKRTHETGAFKCCFCEKIFSTPMKKACHEKYTHKNGARYITNCPHCNQSFTSYYQRNRHMSKDHNSAAASYKCNICDRNFLMKSKLTYHIKKVHLMERNHICPECGQGFFMKQYLEEHMIKHKGERIHKCAVCQKAYARKKTLREHMRIHNNDRRFKCGLCALAFVQKCSLKSHMLSNHGVTLAEFENVGCRMNDDLKV